MTQPAIEIRGLKKKFWGFQLGPLDMTVPQGGIYAFIGPNGAGKTTTFDLLMGMGKEDEGTIKVFGLDHHKQEAEMKARIGYVTPDLNYGAWKTPKRLVYFLRKFYPDWDDDYCARLLERFGIAWDEWIPKMSFGSKIKLAMAMALCHRPDLLLLDEPTLGVDAVSKKEIFSELLAAVQEESHTVLISSHGLSDLERFADHIGVIHKGKMILEGPTDTLLERFRLAEFLPSNGLATHRSDGFYPQPGKQDRFRAVLDIEQYSKERLEQMGASEITMVPISLEDLFVALVREEG
ncbi:MAG: ABC transporter ATP-binding protein [Candidatus Omnitrophica bacterium]|nr:ABC transporter ATP-binding protein [Candidatus Omnitrophota bacterium]